MQPLFLYFSAGTGFSLKPVKKIQSHCLMYGGNMMQGIGLLKSRLQERCPAHAVFERKSTPIIVRVIYHSKYIYEEETLDVWKNIV